MTYYEQHDINEEELNKAVKYLNRGVKLLTKNNCILHINESRIEIIKCDGFEVWHKIASVKGSATFGMLDAYDFTSSFE